MATHVWAAWCILLVAAVVAAAAAADELDAPSDGMAAAAPKQPVPAGFVASGYSFTHLEVAGDPQSTGDIAPAGLNLEDSRITRSAGLTTGGTLLQDYVEPFMVADQSFKIVNVTKLTVEGTVFKPTSVTVHGKVMLGASIVQSAGVLSWADARKQAIKILTAGPANLCAYSGPGPYLTGQATLTVSPVTFSGSAESFVNEAVLNLPQGAFDLQVTCSFDAQSQRQPAGSLPVGARFIKKLAERRAMMTHPHA